MVLGLAWAALSVCFLPACGKSAGGPVVPVPSVSSSLPAQEAFRRIEARFSDLSPEARPSLENPLREFLEKYGTDDRARLARLYLAWIELDRKHLTEARGLALPVRKGPPGAAHDFADIVEAAARRREGRALAALELLEPLRGKIADPLERALYSEELVHALIAAPRLDDAIRAMLDWAEQAQPGDRDAVVASIEALLREMPKASLEAGLRTLEDEALADPSGKNATLTEARRWLSGAARTRLVRTALTKRDPELAKRLVESSASRFGHDESEDALEALASTSAVAPRVLGRAVGVVLDVVDETSRGRSADLIAGMTRALGFPAAAAREDAVRLVTRDASEQGDAQRALASLAGDGASILVAGVTDDAAIAASVFAERAQIPVMVLRRPVGIGAHTRFTFFLGVDAVSEEAAVAGALASASIRNPVRVGPGGTPCDAAPIAAGETRFPVKEWKRLPADALVLLGDEGCTRDAIAEASFVGLNPLLILGLESGAANLPNPRVVVTAGRFPLSGTTGSPEERAWVARFSAPPSWYETLGHDAAVLAAGALATFPLNRVDDPHTVARLHRDARDGLERAEGKLWSTTASGFHGGTAIPRELHAARRDGSFGTQ
ncbi:MAG TPA: hypothetical protein VF395_15395 [Polyangiaceae bacterium]